MYTLLPEEEKYYKDYQWCLDPQLQWGDLRQRFSEELERWQNCPQGWQEREHTLNCWLMASALWQVFSDYIIRGNKNLGRLSKYPLLRRIARFLQEFNEASIRLRNKWFDRRALASEEKLCALLESLAQCLIKKGPAGAAEKSSIKNKAREWLSKQYPGKLAGSRIKIPSAFRSLDITHHDILRLLKDYANDRRDRYTPVIIVGVRTAGSYFAPLAKTYLKNRGFAFVECMTMRPKECVSQFEVDRIRKGTRVDADFLVIDEIVCSGSNIYAALKVLREHGVRNNKISLAFPVYPAHNRWKQEIWVQRLAGIRIYPLYWHSWYMAETLKVENVRKMMKEYFNMQDLQLISIEESPKGNLVDNRFGQPDRVGWRLKQVYRIKLWDREGKESYEDVMAKGVGWGWFGYHAYIEADRLKEYVPPLLGLRSGLVFMKWIDGKRFGHSNASVSSIVPSVLEYINARMSKLALVEDRTFREYSTKYYCGQWLCSIVARAYGKKIGFLMRPFIRRMLRAYTTKYPTVIDGKMAPDEWLVSDGRFWKVDYEHHAYGTRQLNIGDPIFDLASFIFEFKFGREQLDEVVRRYIERTGDRSAKDKVFLYIWLIAYHHIYQGREYLAESFEYHRSLVENEKYVNAGRYMRLLSSEFLGTTIRMQEREAHKKKSPVLIGIDGAINNNVWAFQVMSMSGIRGLSLLRSHNFKVYVNSSLSLDEVKAYCRYFSLAGGIAEYGSVAWDKTRDRELVLVDEEAQEQLDEMRNIILEYHHIYNNPAHRYVIEAFQYERDTTVPLRDETLMNILAQRKFDRLRSFHGRTHTIITSNRIDRGVGMRTLIKENRNGREPVIAFGNTQADIPLLVESDVSFVPRSLIRENGVLQEKRTIIPMEDRRSGLLDAARLIVRRFGQTGKQGSPCTMEKDLLMLRLIDIAEKPQWAKFASFFGHA